MALTHHELCQIAYKFLKRNGFKVCFHDRFVAVTSTGEQPDAMGFRNSASCLIEAKCSRADLLADRKKRFRKNPSLGMGDWRMKWATYIPGHPDANDGWIIPGASWKPSHWMRLPEPPQEMK